MVRQLCYDGDWEYSPLSIQVEVFPLPRFNNGENVVNYLENGLLGNEVPPKRLHRCCVPFRCAPMGAGMRHDAGVVVHNLFGYTGKE
jgi:hypothetical protein